METRKIKRKRCKLAYKFLVFAGLLAITGFTSIASAYDLPDDRRITWQGNVGVTGGIPTRTTICSTLSPGVTSAQINSALSSCPSGQVVYLNAGTYSLTGTISLTSNKTLRGAGPDVTILSFTADSLSDDISIYSGYTTYSTAPIAITSGYTKGSTQLVLSNASSFSSGNFVYISELNDATIPVTINGTGGSCTYCGIYGANGTRVRVQIAKVTAVNGNTISIDPPMYFTFSSGNSPMVNKTPAYYQYSGIEDLTIENYGTSMSGYRRNIHMQGAANCWVKNVKVTNCGKQCIGLDFDTFRNEIRDSYLSNCLDQYNSDTCYGVQINTGSANLIENNIFNNLAAAGVVLVAASGNVAGYNYSYGLHRTANLTSWFWPDDWTHGAHSSYNLFEGNNMQAMEWDVYWGSNSHNVLFRNRITSKDPTITYDPSVAALGSIITSINNHYMTHIGNILGTTGWNNTYEIRNSTNWTSKPIYSTGAFGNDNAAFTTMLRHMNYDYFTNSMKQCGDAGEPGCQGGNSDTILSSSLYLSSKPQWFGGCTWPPVDPVGPALSDIPAKLRFQGSSCSPVTPLLIPNPPVLFLLN